MSVAVFVTAGIALAVLVAAFVLRPVWRGTRGPALAVGTGMVVAAGLLYLLVGTPAALDPGKRRAPDAMADAVAQLEAELERSPQQAEGWRLLGRAYDAQGRAAEAAEAFAQVARLWPDDPEALVQAAEARALARDDRKLDAQAVAWLEQALMVAPGHQRARWFRGIAYRQAGDPAAAARTWEPLLAKVDASTAGSLREQIDIARNEAGLPALPPPASTSDAVAGAVVVTVDVSPVLADRVPAGAMLYVIARQAGGPPIPVAVERLPSTGFPVEVTLDDSDSPMPTVRLSEVAGVEVVARISASGDAAAARGDLESSPLPAVPGESAAITIDRVVE